MEREREFMPQEVWHKILHDYVVPYKEMNRFCPPTLIPHKDGEPLLNKKLAGMLKYASDLVPDMNIDIYSHGLMLPKWAERGEDFIDFLGSLPNKCRYLMSYHPKNHDGSLNDYTQTRLYMEEMLRNRKPFNVEVIMVAHASQQTNQAEIENWKGSWQEIVNMGLLTVHANVRINPWTGKIDEPNCVEFNGCPYGDFGHMFFGATGNIIACCMDLEEEIIFGNVMKDEPQAMVDKLTAFYAEQQRIGRDKTGLVHEVCRDCMGMGKRTDLNLVELGVKT